MLQYGDLIYLSDAWEIKTAILIEHLSQAQAAGMTSTHHAERAAKLIWIV